MFIAVVLLFAYRQKQKANVRLTHLNSEIARQKLLVEEKQKEILDSIYYAKRIRQAQMPTDRYIERKPDELKK